MNNHPRTTQDGHILLAGKASWGWDSNIFVLESRCVVCGTLKTITMSVDKAKKQTATKQPPFTKLFCEKCGWEWAAEWIAPPPQPPVNFGPGGQR